MSTYTNREDHIVQALQAIATLPEGDVKKKLSKELSDQLTVRESIDIAAELSAFQTETERTEEYDKYLTVIFSVYDLLGVPLDIPVGEVSPEVYGKIDRIRPMVDELNALLKRISAAYNEGDRNE